VSFSLTLPLSNVLPSSNKKPLTIPSPAKKLCFNEISRGNFIARNQEAEIEDFSEKHREVWRGCEDKRKKKKRKRTGKEREGVRTEK
jgi:hypothetical protein